MDGSCNGYQHLSAMGLDPIGGRATNLMGLLKTTRRIFYQWVSRPGLPSHGNRCLGDRDVRSEAARQLLAIMDRELAKNATMTTPYGVTLRTIYKALCEKPAIQALKDSEKCAMYLAKLLVECIPEVAVEAEQHHGMASRSGRHYREAEPRHDVDHPRWFCCTS